MSDSTLYLYDSLLAETSHTIANLSRIETTLAAYDLPYKVIDVTTDDKALELWNSQSNGRTLPALVKFGRVIGSREEIEEWNKHGELWERIHSLKDPDITICGADMTAAADATDEPVTVENREAAATDTLSMQNKNDTKNALSGKVLQDVPKPQAGVEDAPIAPGGNTDTVLGTGKSTSAGASLDTRRVSTASNGTVAEKNKFAQERETPATSQHHYEGVPKSNNTEDVPHAAESVDMRPWLAKVPELAAEPSENFQADNVGDLGLIEHHRSVSVSSISQDEVVR